MSNDTFLREVEEELRSDRVRDLWRRYGPILIGGAVGVVLIVAINEGWQWWQNYNSSQSSDRYYAAVDLVDKGDVAGATTALDEVIASGHGGYPALARFKQAGLLASQGQNAEAVAAYDALASTESNPRLRELALVLAAGLLVDTGSLADVESRVGALVEGSPLRNSAREYIGLAAYRAGDLDKAADSFGAVIADPTSPRQMRSRVQLYMAQLVAEGYGDDAVAAVPVEAPADAPAADAAAPLDAAPEAAPVAEPAAPSEASPAEPEPAAVDPAAEPATPAN